MALRDVRFAEEYRSGLSNALDDFFLPALRAATRYDRAVGYFSSSALECFAEPLNAFVQYGGSIRLITSVELHAEDVEVILKGSSPQEICEQRIAQILEREFSGATVTTGLQRLAALLEIGRLSIKIAITPSGLGIYHEKVGLFTDSAGDYVAFSGSTNESRHALIHNYECIDVFPSWESPTRASRKKEHFESLWAGRSKGALTFDFPEAAKRQLIRIVKNAPVRTAPNGGSGQSRPLWRHQELAVAEFLEKRQGILEMATGTGKTRTALAILSYLTQSSSITTAIVTADGNDLLDQWSGDLSTTLSDTYPRFRLLRHYGTYHDRDEYLLDPESSVLLCSRQALHLVLQRLSPAVKRTAVIVHDEVHRFGSASHVRELDGTAEEVPWRLGLSATPEREYDEQGNDFITRNVGPVIYRYPLERAISDGVLCGLDYVPLTWSASDDDKRAVQALVRRRYAKEASSEPMSEEEFRREVARVYKVSTEKVPVFASFVESHPEALDRCIVFVAEKQYGEYVLDHIHAVTPRFHTYYHVDDTSVLKEFAAGVIDCLITCHRVSEGIDIRSVKTVVLLSADRARLETIQRIGRCLRTDPNDPEKRALVVDFIRERNNPDDEPTSDEERKVWLQELATIRRSKK